MQARSTNVFQQQGKVQQKKKKSRFKVTDNVVEQFRDVGRSVKSGLKNDLVKGMGSTAMKSIFNPKQLGARKSETGFQPERPFRRPALRKREIERPREVYVFTAKEHEMKQKIEEIRAELKEMIAQLKAVDKEIKKAVQTPIPEAGVYYINFLNRLKVVLAVLGKELGRSNTWLQMSQSRKKHRGYWALYKKKGTKFGLSSELKVGRQTG